MWFLRLKHWQIFCIIIPAFILQNFTWEMHVEATIIIKLTGSLGYFIWPLIMGDALHNIAGKKYDLNHNFFLINALVFLISIILVFLLAGPEGFHVAGLTAIPFLYCFFAFIYYYAYPVKALKAIETGKDVSLGDYIGDFFLLLFFPIGIWFTQPRLNKIAMIYDGKDSCKRNSNWINS